jgi:hypothetical protein
MSVELSLRAKTILNDPALIRARDQRMDELTAFYRDPNRPHTLSNIPIVCGRSIWWPCILCDEHPEDFPPEAWVKSSLEALAEQASVHLQDRVFCPLSIESSQYGVHYIDRLFGAEIFIREGQIYNRYLKTPIGSLTYPDLEHHPLWIHSKRVLQGFLEADAKLVYFGLPTIASALNIAINLYGQEILCAMLEEPEAAKHDLAVITELLCDIHRYYRDHLPPEQLQPVVSCFRTQPIGCGQVCGCSTQLISKELYDEFIAPCDEAVLGVYPNPGMIHLCGSHSQHIETFRGMKHLHAVQLNDRAADDLQLYFDGLREDQVIYFTPTPNVSLQDAMRITEGRRLILAAVDRPV